MDYKKVSKKEIKAYSKALNGVLYLEEGVHTLDNNYELKNELFLKERGRVQDPEYYYENAKK